MPARSITALLIAALASLALAGPALAAPGDLPRLTGAPPTDVVPDWFDDHSVSSDNHLSWSTMGGEEYTNSSGETSQREPKDVEFQTTLNVGGPGGLELCGYPSGTLGWMRAYQVAPGDVSNPGSCPAAEPAGGRFGWFRYVYGRHPEALNRWHVMDLERAALVPLDADVPTLWDNHWGTCLNLDSGSLNCVEDRNAPGLDVGVAGGAKITALGQVDAQTIPLTVETALGLPDGHYQVVTLTNPYGLIKENGGAIGSVQCVTIDLSIPKDPNRLGFLEPTITVVDDEPATCLLPTRLDPALTGPGGVDPMAGADSILPCVFDPGPSGHCWPTPPHSGNHIAAHSLATGNPAVTPRTTIARGSQIPASIAATGLPIPAPVVTPVTPSGGAPTMPAPPVASTQASTATVHATSVATGHARTAVRRMFGTGLSRLRVACRLRPAGAATCAVTFRKGRARYSGHIYLRNLSTSSHGVVRWQYRVEVTRRKDGRTTHVRRAYRVGGAR